jgi:hypothetical protein
MKQIGRKSKNGIRPHSQHLWADAERLFVEYWPKIEEGQSPYTKAELCRLVGVSLRWAEAIVAIERRST